MWQPMDENELVDAIAGAGASGTRLAISCGGSKADVGRRVDAQPLSMAGIAGIVDYDPAELVLTVRPGTPLAEVQALVASQRQMLAFEPYDHGPIFARAAGASSIGGVVAAGVAGSRRVSAGGARDHLLGLRAVSGRGEAFVAGAKVVKNVTGYDLPKLAAGSWGRLFAISEMTLKVLPRPETVSTLAVVGLNPARAAQMMAVAMGSQAELAAIVHIPADLRDGDALTLFRVEGFGPSVVARCAMLDKLLGSMVAVDRLNDAQAAELWDGVRTLRFLPSDGPLWRVNIPPSGMNAVVSTLQPLGARWLADWAGGLLWLAFDGDAHLVREAARQAGGHAMLLRGPPDLRAVTPAFHPQPPILAALEERVRRAFDPLCLFETGRF